MIPDDTDIKPWMLTIRTVDEDDETMPSEASPLVQVEDKNGSGRNEYDENGHDQGNHNNTNKTRLTAAPSGRLACLAVAFVLMMTALLIARKHGADHQWLRTNSKSRSNVPPQPSITPEESPTSPPPLRDTNVNQVFPQELAWSKLSDSYYDFAGTLEFCDGTDSTKAYRTFGYRLASHDPCGTHGINPLIRLQPGYRYLLRLENESNRNETTNIHTHGLHISGSGNGDNIDRRVSPGNVLLYNWTIPHDHPDGTFWYHAHFHPTTKKHVNGGAYGVLLVDRQNNDDGRPYFLDSTERFLLLGTHHLKKKQTLQYANGHLPGQTSLLLMAHQWTRLRVIVVDPSSKVRDLRFDPTVCQVHTVATDGIWRSTVPHPESLSVYSLTGANRLDLAVQCNASSGVWYAVDNIQGEPLVYLQVTQKTEEQGAEPTKMGMKDVMKPWRPQRPSYLQSLLPGYLKANDGDEGEGNSATRFNVSMTSVTINGVSFKATTPLDTFQLDDKHKFHEWSIVNTSLHPFHLHTYWMQIATPGGCGNIYEEGEWYDTISKPVELDDEPCLVRFRMNDIGGRIIMHCHTLSHEDAGTMGWVLVNGGSEPGTNNIEQKPISP